MALNERTYRPIKEKETAKVSIESIIILAIAILIICKIEKKKGGDK